MCVYIELLKLQFKPQIHAQTKYGIYKIGIWIIAQTMKTNIKPSENLRNQQITINDILFCCRSYGSDFSDYPLSPYLFPIINSTCFKFALFIGQIMGVSKLW